MNTTAFFKIHFKGNHFKLIGTLFCAFLLVSTSYAQKKSKEEKKLLKQAKRQVANEDFKEAQKSYLKLIELNGKNDLYFYNAGLSYYFADSDRAKSIPLFENAVKNSKEDTITELYYYLARAYHINGQYDEAKVAFDKFKPSIKPNNSYGKELLKQYDYYLKASNNAKKLIAKMNKNIAIMNLGEGVNTSYGEYAPVINENEDILLFTSRRKIGNNKKVDRDLKPFENIFAAKRVNNKWQLLTDKKEIEKYVPTKSSTKEHQAGIMFSSDGKTLYTYKKNKIWKSVSEKKKWSKQVVLDKNINSSEFNIPSVFLSKDENTMLSVSYRREGFGGKDIYQSVKGSNGKWSRAKNLGKTINTEFDEESPFMSEDGKTLYFSSEGHNGIGGFDIFKSELVNGSWSTPENLGVPINSPLNDVFLIMDKDEMNGYFASNRDGGYGGRDIYEICMDCPTHTINGLIVDGSDLPINNTTVELKNIASNNIFENPETTNGEFTIITDSLGEQELIVDAQNFEKQSTKILLPKTSSILNLKIKLSQFEKNNTRYQVLNLVDNNLGTTQSDTIEVEKIIVADTAIVDNTAKETEPISNTSTTNTSEKTKINIATNTTNKDNSLIDDSGAYLKFYSYNSNKINTEDSNFINFIDNSIADTKKKDKIYVSIESSASTVPTKTYKSNKALASLRANEAKRIIIKSLKDKGVKMENIILKSVKSIVSGPKYSYDYKNANKYVRYQYIKIKISK